MSVRAIADKGKIKIFIWQAGRELHGLCQVEHGEKISLPIPILALDHFCRGSSLIVLYVHRCQADRPQA